MLFGLSKMGSNTSNSIRSNQEIVNSVLQAARASCYAGCKNSINDVTIIVIGGTGDINITQECKLTNIQCILRNQLDSQIENILESMINQSASATNGFSLDFTNISQNVDLYQYIQNTITQTMDSSCSFTAGNEATGLYFYVENRDGSINISQSAQITNATCNMDNIAKAVTYNEETAQTDQRSSIFNLFSLIVIAIVICVIIAAIVMIVFILSGGVAAATGAVASSGGGGSTSTLSPSTIASFVAQNPELLAAL